MREAVDLACDFHDVVAMGPVIAAKHQRIQQCTHLGQHVWQRDARPMANQRAVRQTEEGLRIQWIVRRARGNYRNRDECRQRNAPPPCADSNVKRRAPGCFAQWSVCVTNRLPSARSH